jgi:anti-sigma factor RsiW
MNCERMENLMIAWLDGRARPAEREAVEAHLAACDGCRRRAEEFRALWAAMDESPAIEPSPAFDARLRQRIEAEPQPRLFGWLLPAPGAALAFVALLIVALAVSWTLPVPQPEDSYVVMRSEEEFRMIRDLALLEDYEVLVNFEVLGELPNGEARP